MTQENPQGRDGAGRFLRSLHGETPLKDRLKKMRAARMDKGLCVDCAKKLDCASKRQCRACLDKHPSKDRLRKMRAARMDKGLCVDCAKKLDCASKRQCRACLDKPADYRCGYEGSMNDRTRRLKVGL